MPMIVEPKTLNTSDKSFRILAFEELGSTNDEAKRLAAEGAPHGTVVWAKRQTAGRGRRGRTWASPEGNLFCSIIVGTKGAWSSLSLRERDGVRDSETRLPHPLPHPNPLPRAGEGNPSHLSFICALAVADMVREFLPSHSPQKITLKWPNDVLVDKKKISGILLEADLLAVNPWLVAGIGVNVKHYPDDTPYSCTSLKAEGVETTAETALHKLVSHFGKWLSILEKEGFAPVRAAWLNQAENLGGNIIAKLSDKNIPGTFVNIDKNGALLLKDENGKLHTITSADVFWG